MPLDIKFVSSIAERDVDFLVMEEWSASREFQDWFAARVYGYPAFGTLIGAWHSVVDAGLGETDILVVFNSEEGQRLALLIENKISAPPQPKQSQRYTARGEKGISEGYWEEFKCCVIAPKKYLDSSLHSNSYECEIAYEELLAFFASRRCHDQRFSYKAKVLQEAIEQNRRGYQPDYSAEMTDFVKKYALEYSSKYPRLGMQEAKPRPSQSSWVNFYPTEYEKGTYLCHQLNAGKAKIFFLGAANRFPELETRLMPLLHKEMEISLAGKSVAITIDVPSVDPLERTYEEEKNKVKAGIEAIQQLHDFIIKNELLHVR